MGFEVCEGGKVDPKQLQDLYEFVPWARGRDIDRIKQMLENTDYAFSVREGRRLVGFVRVLTDRIYRATLWDMVVHPEFQGKGVGEALMKAVLKHPVLSRVQKFWLNTRDKKSFYEQFGFKASDQGMFLDRAKEKGP